MPVTCKYKKAKLIEVTLEQQRLAVGESGGKRFMHPTSPTLSVSLLIMELNDGYTPPGLLSCLTFRSHSSPWEGLQ